MTIYQVTPDKLEPISRTTFAAEGVREKEDLQRLLREQVEIISPNTLVIAEEFGEWEDSRRRIDLLGIDKDASLVVIELKRTEDGGHMELQAIRYAAMISALTFSGTVDIYKQYLTFLGREDDPREILLEFLEWDEPDEEKFAQDIRIILASAEFSKEITTSVLWLNEHGLDIRCVRLRPYRDESRLLLDVQQVIPLPEAEEYQVKIRDKARLERVSRSQTRDMTRFDVVTGDKTHSDLPKRWAAFHLIHYLCSNGVDPEEIRKLITWKGTAIRVVPGTLDAETLEVKLDEQLIAEGNKPYSHRFFIAEDQLIHANGNTYVVSKMWGARTAEALDMLVNKYKDKNVSFKISG